MLRDHSASNKEAKVWSLITIPIRQQVKSVPFINFSHISSQPCCTAILACNQSSEAAEMLMKWDLTEKSMEIMLKNRQEMMKTTVMMTTTGTRCHILHTWFCNTASLFKPLRWHCVFGSKWEEERGDGLGWQQTVLHITLARLGSGHGTRQQQHPSQPSTVKLPVAST